MHMIEEGEKRLKNLEEEKEKELQLKKEYDQHKNQYREDIL